MASRPKIERAFSDLSSSAWLSCTPEASAILSVASKLAMTPAASTRPASPMAARRVARDDAKSFSLSPRTAAANADSRPLCSIPLSSSSPSTARTLFSASTSEPLSQSSAAWADVQKKHPFNAETLVARNSICGRVRARPPFSRARGTMSAGR